MGVTELGQTAAFFAIILLAGFIAGRFDLLSKPARSGLTNLILFVTLPCTIVGSFDVAYDPRMLGTMGLTLLIAVLALVVAQLASMVFFRKLPRERRSVLRYSLIVCNSGFFGMSIVAALFGGPALSLGAVYLIPQRFAMWSFGMACFTTERQGRALLKTTIHPCMIAVYIGFTLLLLQWELP
ncbi:MAG: AEC family transporter, partial [Clostridiales Family XIII bacterium]|nr:AEC family transporter [Clostridiales Family XIII bacterium]